MLGSLTREEFLQRHWQRSPLLVRGALPGFQAPLSADDLAELACAAEVESRLVRGRLGGSWQLEHGPFEEATLAHLPERDWTLLVQDVDKWVPEVAALLALFRFIPDWRIDDIMVSFAAPGGSVGPHTDQYDVFLLQAQGRRRWQLSERFDPSLVPDIDIKLLERFDPEQEFVVEPGDLLYLPPNVAHYGLALDAAMTLSIGFRAPNQRELVGACAEHLIESAREDLRFRDPARTVAERPSRISEADLAQLRELVRSGLVFSDAELDRLIGRSLTQPKLHLEVDAAFRADETPEAGVPERGGDTPAVRRIERRLAGGERLARRLGARLLLVPRADELWLFADGQHYQLDLVHLEWLEPLAEGGVVDASCSERFPGALHWLATLLARGCVEWQVTSQR